jgi:S1-C subfamily serine protease
LSSAPFTSHADADRRAAVMVQGGAGHGSGFFIDKRGDILTNAHVVGDALHVRIVLADREKEAVGEVLRSDKARDVALVRLMDETAVPAVLPFRKDWPGVGEKVYAIGAPRDTRLQDSVTSGIVSAWRKNFAVMGARQDFIQSDVTVQPGNSGGPLLDQNGNIVALADAGLMSNDNSTGLNYFIPIEEALNALGITLQ